MGERGERKGGMYVEKGYLLMNEYRILSNS